MKTIVSLALAGLMSISALLPALAAQEAESVSIAESSSISESMAQDESSVSVPVHWRTEAPHPIPAVQRMKEPNQSPAAMRRMDRILSRSPNPTVCRWSLTAALLWVRKLKPAARCLFLKAQYSTKQNRLPAAKQRNRTPMAKIRLV